MLYNIEECIYSYLCGSIFKNFYFFFICMYTKCESNLHVVRANISFSKYLSLCLFSIICVLMLRLFQFWKVWVEFSFEFQKFFGFGSAFFQQNQKNHLSKILHFFWIFSLNFYQKFLVKQKSTKTWSSRIIM